MERSKIRFSFWKNLFFFAYLFIFSGVVQSIFPFHLQALTVEKGEKKLEAIHSKLDLRYGTFKDEYPEQLMAAMFIGRNAKVLELGGNIGRNSCVIASILKNSKNLVVSEPCLQYAEQLQENRDLNELEFQIERSAVSKVNLMQSGWTTIPSHELLPGYTLVEVISFKKLQKKYNIVFDTLVVDCEGALYQMLYDDPSILKNIDLVIIENDFLDIVKFNFVKEKFQQNGLQVVYSQAGGWGPCYDFFYQVWKKSKS
ncbi:MAG: hypothetical protein ACH350_07330 [Parachlamydiaceae bacterium]